MVVRAHILISTDQNFVVFLEQRILIINCAVAGDAGQSLHNCDSRRIEGGRIDYIARVWLTGVGIDDLNLFANRVVRVCCAFQRRKIAI